MKQDKVYSVVTDRIIAALESGTVPWRMPWVGGYPYSLRSGKPYRGINPLLLSLAGFGDPRWGTYRAVKEAGGQVRRGEKSTTIVLWKPASRKEQREGEEVESRYMLLRLYSVFNAEQCSGLPELQLAFENDPIERAEEIVSGYIGGPGILFGGGQASYEPYKDLVRCPEIGNFRKVEGYYSTLYHELIHSTGHESRLKRIEPALFGTEPYAQEELVAEMGAAMLCGMAGIDNLDQNAAYLEGWLHRLRDDPKLVVKAGAQAQKAADLILGTTFAEGVVEETEAVAA